MTKDFAMQTIKELDAERKLKFWKIMSILFIIAGVVFLLLSASYARENVLLKDELDAAYNISDYILAGWNETLTEYTDCQVELIAMKTNLSEEEVWSYYNAYLEGYEDEI